MHHMDFIARAMQDKTFRDRLKANPEQVVQESGTNLNGARIKVVENTADTFYVAMPGNPNAFLDDGTLEKVAGGGWNPFKAIKDLGIKASSAGTVLSTASSADIANVAGKNTEKVAVVTVNTDTGVISDPTMETHRIKH